MEIRTVISSGGGGGSLVNSGISQQQQPEVQISVSTENNQQNSVKKSPKKRRADVTTPTGRKKKEKVAPGPKGIKLYNCKWENDPILKAWISRHPEDQTKVLCHFCQSFLRAHRHDLLEHARTHKHQKNFRDNSTPEEYNRFVKLCKEMDNSKDSKRHMLSPKDSTGSSSSNSTIVNSTASNNIPFPSSSSAPTITFIAPSDSNAQRNSTSNSSIGVKPFDHIYSSSTLRKNPSNGGGDMTEDGEMDFSNISTLATLTSSTEYNSRNCSSPVSNTTTTSNSSGNNGIPSSVQTFLNLTASSSSNNSLDDVLGDAEDLWHESEDFASSNSPSASALVSVILEEQLSPGNQSHIPDAQERIIPNHHHQSVIQPPVTLNSMLLNGINLDIIHDNSEGPQHNNYGNPNVTAPMNVNHNNHHETLLLSTKSSTPFTIHDILTAIEANHFSFSDLCSLAKSAVSQVDKLINGHQQRIAFCAPTSSTTINSLPAATLSLVSHHETEYHSVHAGSNSYRKDKHSATRRKSTAGHQQ